MVELEKRGIPCAVICSEPFLGLGRTQAAVLGVPDLPIIVVPHPLGGIALEEVRLRALALMPAVLDLIRGKA